jgi:hypothetical protein
MSGTNFDGSRGGAAGDGTALGGAYSGLDGVAANLKPNPVADTLSTNPVPAQVAGNMSQSQQMQQAIMMMVATAVVGGLVSGVCGMVFGTSTNMMAMRYGMPPSGGSYGGILSPSGH